MRSVCFQVLHNPTKRRLANSGLLKGEYKSPRNKLQTEQDSVQVTFNPERRPRANTPLERIQTSQVMLLPHTSTFSSLPFKAERNINFNFNSKVCKMFHAKQMFLSLIHVAIFCVHKDTSFVHS